MRLASQDACHGICVVPPMSYLQFLRLQSEATLMITDSGGVQEETTALGIPCLTVRENTERPITVSEGTNMLSRAEWPAGWSRRRARSFAVRGRRGRSPSSGMATPPPALSRR